MSTNEIKPHTKLTNEMIKATMNGKEPIVLAKNIGGQPSEPFKVFRRIEHAKHGLIDFCKKHKIHVGLVSIFDIGGKEITQ